MKKRLNMGISLRRIAFFMLFCLLNCAFAATAQAQKVTVSSQSHTLRQVMGNVEKQTGYKFFYDNSQIDTGQSANITSKKEDLPHFLHRLFMGTGIDFKIVDKTIVLTKKQTSQTQHKAQAATRKTVSGIVTDDKGEPVIGATVIEHNTANGTVTDMNGHYKIEVDDHATLAVNYIGYDRQLIAVGQRSNINFTLHENVKQLNELVVMAYGTQKRRDVTGAMQTLDFSDLSDVPAAQFTQKMQGQLAGVQVNQASGTPGQGINVRIRGAASLSTGAQPLYVVDGFPITGDINSINPNEIETMSVLKDAAATALYGSRAAFGVVLITTRKAKAHQTSVDLDVYYGQQTVPSKGRPDMMNGTEWAQFRKENYEDLGNEVPEIYQNPSQYGQGYDWYDAMLRTAAIQDYNITIRSGNEKFSNSTVLGYFDQEGVTLNSDYMRFTMRSNSSYQLNRKVKAVFGIAPMYSSENRPGTNGAFFNGGGGLLANATLASPILSWVDDKGEYPVSINTPGVTQLDTPNWVRSIMDTKNKYINKRLLANVALEVTPLESLVLKEAVSVDIGSTYHHYFQPSTAGRAFAAAPSKTNANLAEENNRYYSWLSETTASYTRSVGKHEIDLLAGFTAQRFRSDYSGLWGSNFADDRIETINAALVKSNPSMDVQEWSMLSYLGRVNYSFADRYLLSASIRRDGSSRFGSKNKWGNFPALSAGWIISEERWMAPVQKWLSLLKVRASYGLIGNNNIGNYTQYNVISNSNAVFGSSVQSGSRVSNLGNDELGWERTAEFDLGVDLSFLNNRITVTYDYYHKTTKDLLYMLSVPRESGFAGFMGNVGKLRFWGHELAITSHNLTGRFNWTTNFNISTSDNKVLKLSGLSNQLVAYTGIVSTITKVGGRIGQFYGMVQDGVYRDQADYDRSPKAVDSEVGTIKFHDVNDDKKITYDDEGGDKTIIGNPFPDFTFGLTNTFSYRGFDLSILLTGAVGNDIATPMEQGTTNLDGLFNVLRDVKDRWRSEAQPGEGKYGKTTGGTGRERDQFHSRYIKDGSYLAVKNVTIGYTFPEHRIPFVKRLRLYLSAQQLFVISSYPYGNPEVGIDYDGNVASSLLQGVDYSSYPVPRTITIGANITF